MLRTILIVDDNMINCEILKGMLCKNYAILEAENGEDALRLMHRNYKLLSAILLDIVMPVMDGYEVLRRMQGNVALSQIPVIVVTGSEDESSRVRALALGANDFVTKPYNPDIIMHCLRNNITMRETASIVNAIQRDKLTGIYNREFFFEKAAEMIRSHEPGYYVLSCFDIDNSKLVNDQLGAAEGDRILKHIGSYIKRLFSEVQGICGRISGDNFAGLFPNTTEIADKIAGEYDADLLPRDTPAYLQCSIGRYVINDRTLPVSAIYDRAYIAKRSVKGRYDKHLAYFDNSMLEALTHEQKIIAEMDRALSERQFEVWFQPQYNHSTGFLIGAEALVRWRHPVNGLIPPGDFIPVFERNGFIYELDKYVWEQTCKSLRKWIDEGRRPLPISVNISRYDIFRADLIDVVVGMMKQYAIPVDLLRLEITESAFATSTDQIVRIVKTLIEYGFTIEIDDFGSGYSSLNTLKSVPAQIVKLDMRFLEGDDDSERGGNILESIVRMSKWLGMSVIAEGVETLAQADFLKSIGCSYVQGYLYARPMQAGDYESLLDGSGREARLLALETVENLDNNAFWNPGSMDTLIFNSYVGAACIFEYYKGNVELLRANSNFVHLLGNSAIGVDDILKLDWLSCLTEEGRKTVRSALRHSIETGKEVSEEYVFCNIPGCPAKTYLRSTMRVIASAGARYLVYCSSENITAQREAEQRERAVAEQLRLIMHNINGGVTATVINHAQAQFLYSNNQYYDQLGYTRDQFLQEVPDAFALVHPDDRENVIRAATSASMTRQPYTIAYRIIRRDKSVRWMLSNISVMDFPNVDEPVQLAVANDITVQVEAEQNERRTAEQMQAVMDNVSLGITATIVENGAVKILFSNNRYYEILGYTRAQYQAEIKDPYMTIHPDDQTRVIAESTNIGQAGTPIIIKYRALRRDGSLIWLISAVNYGRFSGVEQPVQLAMFRDISEEQQVETTLQMLMDDTPGGFCRMQIFPQERRTKMLYFNEGFCKLTGMTRDEVLQAFDNKLLGGTHPDDFASVQGVLKNLVQNGGQLNVKCRILHGKSGFVRVQFNGRFIKTDTGQTFLNAYYSDISGQIEL